MDYGYISIIELCLVFLEVIRMERFYFKGDWRLFDKRLFFFLKLGIDKRNGCYVVCVVQNILDLF